MENYITCFLQVLSFSSSFKRFEMRNFFRRPTMVAENFCILRFLLRRLDYSVVSNILQESVKGTEILPALCSNFVFFS